MATKSSVTRPRPGRQQGHNGRASSGRGISNRRVSPRLMGDIRREARSLGLSTEQYMRLVVAVSSSLRKGLVNDETVNGAQLLAWVENPMFLALIQWISRYAVAAMQEQPATDDNPSDGEVQHTPQPHRFVAPPPSGSLQSPPTSLQKPPAARPPQQPQGVRSPVPQQPQGVWSPVPQQQFIPVPEEPWHQSRALPEGSPWPNPPFPNGPQTTAQRPPHSGSEGVAGTGETVVVPSGPENVAQPPSHHRPRRRRDLRR